MRLPEVFIKLTFDLEFTSGAVYQSVEAMSNKTKRGTGASYYGK